MIPRPDGWPTDFFLYFLDLVGIDLLKVVEQSRLDEKVTISLNSTFITIIPKRDKNQTFADFRPISLCNLVYKLISKIVATRLNLFLDKAI